MVWLSGVVMVRLLLCCVVCQCGVAVAVCNCVVVWLWFGVCDCGRGDEWISG